MRMDIGYILGHLSEFILFIYYADTSFYPRKSYLKSNLISLCGYIVLFGIGLLSNASLSILSFFIINVCLLRGCYNLKIKNAVFYSIILDTLSVIGEYMVMYILSVNCEAMSGITMQQSLAITVGGKLIYLTGIILLRRFTNQKSIDCNESQMILAFIPLLTIVCLTIIMGSEISSSLFILLSVVFLLINFITFYVNTGLGEKNRTIKALQEEYNQNKAELSEYQLISEKYENTKIMRHDFHKQLSVLKDLIAEDNSRARQYMKQIQSAQRELDYARYTDNRILNILLAQKIKECHKYGIEIHIHSSAPSLSFISDIDTVAIFSNLLDNAIESCGQSKDKGIYVDLYTVNNSYSAVKIENNADKEPIVLDGLLRTQKKRMDIHGIGIQSINNALRKYGSELNWSYDKENKFFSAMILIRIPEKTERSDTNMTALQGEY